MSLLDGLATVARSRVRRAKVGVPNGIRHRLEGEFSKNFESSVPTFLPSNDDDEMAQVVSEVIVVHREVQPTASARRDRLALPNQDRG